VRLAAQIPKPSSTVQTPSAAVVTGQRSRRSERSSAEDPELEEMPARPATSPSASAVGNATPGISRPKSAISCTSTASTPQAAA
jgi:hypothetical protein